MPKAAIARTWSLILRSTGLRYSRPPITPPTLSAVVDGSSQITVTASGAASTLGSITGYRWRRNGTLVNGGTPSASPLVSSGLTAATAFQFTATAIDSAGNESALSAPVSATTASSGDTTAPTIPGSHNMSVINSTTLRSAWTASTDPGGSGLAGYLVERATSAAGPWSQVTPSLITVAIYDHTGLAAGTTYFARVRAADNAGNFSAYSAISSATTAAQAGELRGWELTENNVGLAALGIVGASLPLYTGPAKPPAGTLISGQRITLSELDLSNGNIIVERCLIRPAAAGNRAGLIFGFNPDTAGNQLGNVIIRDCDIDGSAATNNLMFATAAFRGAGSLYRNKIWGTGPGIAYFGSPTVPVAVIEQNYVFGLRAGMYGSPPQQSHNSSATVRGFTGTSMIWRNNRLVSDSGADSGALFLQTFASNIQNVLIEGNMLQTGGWEMPLEAAYGNTYSNMRAINNRFAPGGFGPAYVSGGPGWAQWTENHIFNPLAVDGKGAVVNQP